MLGDLNEAAPVEELKLVKFNLLKFKSIRTDYMGSEKFYFYQSSIYNKTIYQRHHYFITRSKLDQSSKNDEIRGQMNGYPWEKYITDM